MRRFFISGSVAEGQPDKLCGQISDAVFDEILLRDPYAHVACETAITKGLAHVMGKTSTKCCVDVANEARNVILDIGYNNLNSGFDGNTCGIISSIDSQSSDIALGVNRSPENKNSDEEPDSAMGAGDHQGVMFGFACRETSELMPMSISLAHGFDKRLTCVQKEKNLKYLRPDEKTQVTVKCEDDVPKRIDAIVISAQHSEDVDLEKICSNIIETVIFPTVPENMIDSNTKIFVNPTGKFVIGGSASDSGLTGRKIIVDT